MKIGAVGNKLPLMEKLLEIKTPLTNIYSRESMAPREFLTQEDKIKRRTQKLKERFGLTHGSGTRKKNKRRKK